MMRKDFFSQRKGVVLIGVVMSLSASAAQVAISEQTVTGMKATQQQVTQAENHLEKRRRISRGTCLCRLRG
ncbi:MULTISPECIES: hypothetical protein [Photorhabdus]|uniref:hypothetical protein n=2 Tax=Morganellaceae TaxID=1903414 RepID=UPI0018650298|nr:MULTISPECIES: hypothetical protein [Photorhabdus]MCT8342347.1 hypothetical protein [Photorhabdus kleinii]